MAIAKATETDQRISLGGFGRLYVNISLCPAISQGRQWRYSPRIQLRDVLVAPSYYVDS